MAGATRRKKRKYSKFIVAFSIGFIVFYTIAVMYNFYVNSMEPTTLTPYVYGFFGGEMLALSGIKIVDTMKGSDG